ncbi:MAG: hypothetical protein U0746_03130 [Gemmataceae bacterium]
MLRKPLPESLHRDGVLQIPSCLVEPLREELAARGLLEDASVAHPPEKELFGGESDEVTLRHFAQRFKTSAARVGHVVLNPNGLFEPVSTDLLATLFDGSVAILDIPCGSGGGLLGLLSTVAALRAEGWLPRLPVDVQVAAGDCSAKAREVHACLLSRLQTPLADVGMRLTWRHLEWDVTDSFSTAALIDHWFLQCPECEEYLVFVSAFSGFADKHTEHVSRAFQHITERLHNRAALMAWIEPDMNQSRRFLPRITDHLTKWFSSFFGLSSPTEAERFRYCHPFTDCDPIRGQANVRAFKKEC